MRSHWAATGLPAAPAAADTASGRPICSWFPLTGPPEFHGIKQLPARAPAAWARWGLHSFRLSYGRAWAFGLAHRLPVLAASSTVPSRTRDGMRGPGLGRSLYRGPATETRSTHSF